MKLTQLRYFQTICKHNNLTRAAAELHVSQPSLSNAMRELEEEFGISLFYRLSKGLALTKEGRFLLEEADKLLAQADRLEAQMHALGDTNQTIKFGVPPMLASLIFPQLLQSFHTSFPHLHLQMIENGTLTNRSMVLDGMLDAAIVSCDEPLPPSFGSCKLSSLDICLCVSYDHPLAQRRCVSLADTAGLPLALLGEDSFLTSYILRRFREEAITPNVIVNTNQLAAIYQLIENRAAASFLYADPQDTNPKLCHIPVKGLTSAEVYLIWNSGRHLSPATQKLIRLTQTKYLYFNKNEDINPIQKIDRDIDKIDFK